MNFSRLLKGTPILPTLIVLLAGTLAGWGQGSLVPPGPPAPTMKTLSQIEPRLAIAALPVILSNSGAYYLTANLTGISGSNGITVTASGVTLDLNGFALIGVPGALAGITSTVPATGVCVRNGTIQHWPGGGLALGGADAMIDGLYVQSNAPAAGIAAGPHARVFRSTVSRNGQGLSVGVGSQIGDVLIRQNSGAGLAAGDSSTVLNCQVFGNGGHGLILSNSSTAEGCSVRTNALNGILGGDGVRVARCSISLNRSNGVVMGFGGRISESVIASNMVDGIRVNSRNTLAGNQVDYNGLAPSHAGIRIEGTDNRVEDNQLTSNWTGLLSVGGFNLIIRNKATLNETNFYTLATDVATFGTNAATAGSWSNFDY